MQVTMDKKYTYRNGQPARILCVDRDHYRFPIVSLSANGIIFIHQKDGRTTDEDYIDSIDDWALVEEWQPQDKEPVWAWGCFDTATRRLAFYDNINKCVFKYDGTRKGLPYTNYAKVEHVEQWMLDAQVKLEE